MRRVVDTNVPIVANGRDGNPSLACRRATIEFLNTLITDGQIILDLAGAIQREYHAHLHPEGEPGVGDRFYLEILNSHPDRVRRVELPIQAETGQYVHFPMDPALAEFDEDDRKFAAAAISSGAPVANATDTDWLDYRVPLEANGVKVDFVCGDCRDDWFTRL